tara:strand:+ start:2827 stop:4446 length:1620 start_codon:yes stop_codon:yes gene_type:complete
MEGIKQRSTIEYELNELHIIQKEANILSEQIEVNSLKGINTIHENQKTCGKAVRNIFNNKSIINCLVYGMTQTGKTGCMTALIQYFILSNNIPIDNIYIITGLSDSEWKKDTKNRMPDSINSRVFHRANLSKTFMKDIQEKNNSLIIMDEIQIACEDNQTIHKTFRECGFYDLDFLLKNDIKLIQFSATPDGNINDISDWKHHSAKVKLSRGPEHYGPKEALEQDRVRQFKDLTNIDNVSDLKKDIEGNFPNPRYHLVRVPNKRENKDGTNNQSKVISNIKKIFGDNYKYNKNYLKTKKGDINDILKKQPEISTFIFYCEILRCAKTQFKKFIGISYERYVSNPNDSSIIQGSFGRLTGYDDNGDSICYTNKSSLENYIKLWENDMEFKEGIKWNTKTTQYNMKDDITYSTGTFNSVKHIEELKSGCSEKVKEIILPHITKSNNFNEISKLFHRGGKYYSKNKRGPRRKKSDNGFQKETPTWMRNEGPKIISKSLFEEKEKNGEWGFYSIKGNSYRCWACYSDVNDPNTLEWWLIYYEN